MLITSSLRPVRMPTLPDAPSTLARAAAASACAIALLALGMSAVAPPVRAQPPVTHPFGLDDFGRLRQARAIAVSPDGLTVLYAVGHFDASGPEKFEWHTIGVSGDHERTLGLPEQFTPAGFMPDGTTLYGTYRLGGTQALAIVPLDSAKPARVFSIAAGMHGPVISPDGKRFAVLADPRPKDTLASVRTVVENDQTRVYVLGADGADGGWWCPGLEHVSQVAWSPDGAQLAVASQTPKIGYHDARSTIDLCSQTAVKRLAELPAPTSGLAWTDAGRTLVFAGTTTQVLTPDHVWTLSVSGGPPVDQTPRLAASAVGVVGDPHGSVWVEVHKGVAVEIDRFQDHQLTPAYRWPDGIVARPPVFSSYPQSPAVLAFTVGDPTHEENVAVNRGEQLVRITHEGDDAMPHLSLGDVRVVSWTATDGTHLEAIVTFPAGYRTGTSAPFLVLPHGGPEGNDPLEFDTFSRFVAGLGYVVLQPQYRGSTGYGSDFLDAIYQHFGDRAYSDVNSATDYAIAQGWADPHRLAIFGWSAGGFMTSWTVTQTHRYRAAIEGAGITDWLSFIPTSDIAQGDYDARLQEKDPTPFLKFSAVMYASQVTTPLLILHGEADQRVPTFQGREFFVLLAERGKTVRMVTYPGSPHFPRLAEQRRNIFQEVAAWLEKYNANER
jgi:dipeptidyl aminopeptidase/acylaminoacyl peptidase